MFWRKTRAAIGQFHPLHQGLIWDRAMSATLRPTDWTLLLGSLSQHDTVVRRRKWRLPNRMQTVVVPLTRVLLEDIGPTGSLGITADLRGSRIPGKAGPERQLAVQRPIRSAKEWFVFDPWLAVRAELRDGSVFELTVVDRIRHRKITRVNPRGKWKTKTKTKAVQRITATRTLPKGRTVQQPAGPPPPWIRVRVRTDRRPTIRAVAKLAPMPDETTQTQQLLTVATELFRWTPPAQRARSSA